MSFFDCLVPRINDMQSNKRNFDSFRKFFCIKDGFNFDVQGLIDNMNNCKAKIIPKLKTESWKV